MSNDYEISIPLPIPQLVTSSEKESKQIDDKFKTMFNQKVLGDVETVLQEMADWQKAGDAYEKQITDDVKLRMMVDPLRSLVFLERSVSKSVIDTEQERERQTQLLKTVQPQCNQAVNEIFDRAYVRALERATRLLGDVQMVQTYNDVNCVNSVRMMIRQPV